MSQRLFGDDVLFTQRLLKSEGLYTGKLDGIWGPLTDAAARQFERRARQIRDATRAFDPRSEAQLAGLRLPAQRAARRFLGRLLDAGLDARIISGTRSYAQQNELFRQGRYGNPGPVVTNARGGRSLHNFGLAWDIGLFGEDGRYLTAAAPYARAARIGLATGLEWGGDFRNFVDRPHYQLETDLGLAQVRQRFMAGQPYIRNDRRQAGL